MRAWSQIAKVAQRSQRHSLLSVSRCLASASVVRGTPPASTRHVCATQLLARRFPTVPPPVNYAGVYRGERVLSTAPDDAIALVMDKNLAGMSYVQCGMHEEAMECFSEALSLLHGSSKFDSDSPLPKEALAIADYPNPDHAAALLSNLAVVHSNLPGGVAYALELFQAVARFRDEHESSPLAMANTLSHVALCLKKLGRLNSSIGTFKEVLSLQEEELGPGSLRIASTLNSLGLLYNDRIARSRAYLSSPEAMNDASSDDDMRASGEHEPSDEDEDFDMAESCFHQAVAIHTHDMNQANADPVSFMMILGNLARFYKRHEQWEEARTFYRHLLTIQEEELGPHNDELIDTLVGLASVYHGDTEAQRESLQRAHDIAKLSLGDDAEKTLRIAEQLEDLQG